MTGRASPPPETAVPSVGRSPQGDGGRPSLRAIVDTLICLAVAVILVRGFLVEGYLISTGSMAPHLYGEHKRAVCPSCGAEFAVGTEFDDSAGAAGSDRATCPNCLYDEIALDTRPIERGDHLLVWKNAFVWREPRRWEVVVFQNPNKPRETFIKRVAGLPGETIQIVDGNLFVNGALARKPWARQRPSLFPVHDTRFVPEDRDWAPRWTPRDNRGEWTLERDRIAAQPDDADEWTWIDYRHTRRHGGTHETSVALAEPLSEDLRQAFAPRDGEFPYSPSVRFPGVRYDRDRHALVGTGVLSPATMHRLLSVDPTAGFVRAVEALAAQSRIAPIDDVNAYNAAATPRSHFDCDELFVAIEMVEWSPESEIAVALRVDGEEFVCRCHPESGAVDLMRLDNPEPLQRGTFEPDRGTPLVLEFSSVDRQLSVGVNGRERISAVPLPDRRGAGAVSTRPVSVGIRGGAVTFAGITIERDLVYTEGGGAHGIAAPYRLGPDEFFMLGDNSPVSSDSRGWQLAGVPRKLLVGKPFLVHLPSGTVEFHWGDRPIRLRIPDVSRMRFVE